jgi:hypothetical protein
MITMASAMSAAWSTTPVLRDAFLGSSILFGLAAIAALGGWMVLDYTLILPSEQTFRQGQAHRSERSPVKRDTEEIQREIREIRDRLPEAATDGGTDE